MGYLGSTIGLQDKRFVANATIQCPVLIGSFQFGVIGSLSVVSQLTTYYKFSAKLKAC